MKTTIALQKETWEDLTRLKSEKTINEMRQIPYDEVVSDLVKFYKQHNGVSMNVQQ